MCVCCVCVCVFVKFSKTSHSAQFAVGMCNVMYLSFEDFCSNYLTCYQLGGVQFDTYCCTSECGTCAGEYVTTNQYDLFHIANGSTMLVLYSIRKKELFFFWSLFVLFLELCVCVCLCVPVCVCVCVCV